MLSLARKFGLIHPVHEVAHRTNVRAFDAYHQLELIQVRHPVRICDWLTLFAKRL